MHFLQVCIHLQLNFTSKINKICQKNKTLMIQNQQTENVQSKRCQLSQSIRQQTYKKFNELFMKKYKKLYYTQNIYTVICSIGIINKSSGQVLIVGLANGTKSLPYPLYAENKAYLLKDMHAQILVIKSFRKFILKQITKENSPYFIKDSKKNKLYFDNFKYEIFLFSSEPFCGDCSINQEQQLFSGSKPLKYFNCNNLPNQKFEKHVLRTKPGRIDLPQNKKSLSLSCSDKLALYNILGIQGKQLFRKVKPIYIDLFIVECQTSRKSFINEGLNFVYRLSQLRNQSEELIKRKIFKINIDQKERTISSQFKSINPFVTCIEKPNNPQNSHKLIEVNLQTKKKEKEGFQVSLIYTEDCLQWINSKTGLPQGCSLNNFMKKGKVSAFCKKKFLSEFSKIHSINQSNPGQIQLKNSHIKQTFKYSAIKDRIKLLFGIWTNNFKGKQGQQHLTNK